MTWPMLFVSFGILMLISSDILEALKADKLASRHVVVAYVWLTIGIAIATLEKID